MKKPQTIRKSAFLTLERLEDRSLPAVVLPLPGADYADVQPLPPDSPVPLTSGDTILMMPASSGNTGGLPSQPSGLLAHPEYLPIESPYDHVSWQNWPGRLLAHPEYLPIESPYDHISWRPGSPVLVSPVSVRPLTLLQSPAVSLFSRIQLTIQRWIQDVAQPKQDRVLTELDQAIRKLEEIKSAGELADATQEAKDKANWQGRYCKNTRTPVLQSRWKTT